MDDGFDFPPKKSSKLSPPKSKLRKNSMIINEAGANTQIIKICFTGGPCAGKTTALSEVATMLRDKGYECMIVPEAATTIFSAGGVLNMTNYTQYQGLQFQKALLGLQIALEKQFVDIMRIKPVSEYVFVLCDRGLLDGSAYIDDNEFDGMLEECSLDRNDCLNTYDIVIHMVTAAKGAKDHYTLMNNEARDETLEKATLIDEKLHKAWCAHPNFFYNTNKGVSSFNEKIKRAGNYILKKLGMPINSEFHRKFTIRNPEGKLFEYMKETYNCILIKLTDIFFENTTPEDEDSLIYYIRRRVRIN